ncbi:MAG: hypothetical protein COB02_06815 [Candidatus Cloacimonadota bacterium]|nr:MAG: hypothetical protein COB02_06815 [Candidatus Cloacimonadota bacterium]
MFGYRVFWILISFGFGALFANQFFTNLFSIRYYLFFIVILNVYLFIRSSLKKSFIYLIPTMFFSSLLIYTVLIGVEQKSIPIQNKGLVYGVIWDYGDETLKVRLLSQNNHYLSGFLDLKHIKVRLPIATIIELNPRLIKSEYFKKKWFIVSSELPSPFIGDLDVYAKFICISAKIRLYLKKKIEVVLKDNDYLKSFCLSALLQVHGEESEKIKEGMKRLGLTHIFAVSGFHISILSLLVLYFLSKLNISFKKSFIFLSVFLFLYATITGFSSSVFRALVFSLVLFPKNYIFYKLDRINILSIICFIHLLVFPLEIYQVGFQLSYGISFLLLLFSESKQTSPLIRVLQFLLLQLLVYLYFLFYFKAYPLFSFIGFCLMAPLTFILITGVFLFVLPQFIISFSLFSYLYQSEDFFLKKSLDFSDYFAWSININVDIGTFAFVSILFFLIMSYLTFLETSKKRFKKKKLHDFFIHLASIKSFDNMIEKKELEYLIYKPFTYSPLNRLDYSYQACLEYLFKNKFSNRELFIELLLGAFFREKLLSTIEKNIKKRDFLDFKLELDRFNEKVIRNKLLGCEEVYSFLNGYSYRKNKLLVVKEIKIYSTIVLKYKRFKNLLIYDESSFYGYIFYIKYLLETFFLYKKKS